VRLVDHLVAPDRYVTRAYAGPSDHPAMVEVLNAARQDTATPEMATVGELDITYAQLRSDPADDVALVERDGSAVAYLRASADDLGDGTRDLIVFTPTLPREIDAELFSAMADALETHMRPWANGAELARYRAYAPHPGPGRPPVDQARWLEDRSYEATEWAAALVRPHLDDVPDRRLPDGVEVRPVEPAQIRRILEVHHEAFRGEWDFSELEEADLVEQLAHPWRDTSLWKVAWAGDTIVGQVKPFVNDDENRVRGVRRGYTEYISTHHDWRGRGIAGALLALSLVELRLRGLTEAALSVDTDNPGGAFALYTGLGFEVRQYEAIYTKPV